MLCRLEWRLLFGLWFVYFWRRVLLISSLKLDRNDGKIFLYLYWENLKVLTKCLNSYRRRTIAADLGNRRFLHKSSTMPRIFFTFNFFQRDENTRCKFPSFKRKPRLSPLFRTQLHKILNTTMTNFAVTQPVINKTSFQTQK